MKAREQSWVEHVVCLWPGDHTGDSVALADILLVLCHDFESKQITC